MLNISDIRKDFPILETKVHDRPLVYLDNAATMQCPEPVLAAVFEQYHCYQANIHRGIHYLSEMSTMRVEEAREKAAAFIGAADAEEIIFTSGTTQGINIVARSLGDTLIKPGDHIMTTQMEHHSNYIPWQQLCLRCGAVLDTVHVTEDGELDIDEFIKHLKAHPVIAAVTCISNVLGTVNPVKEIVKAAHAAGAAVLLDGAQAMRHGCMNVKDLDCDFLCFSGHKIGAPTGTGVLYGKKEWLSRMKPVLFGGGMVDELEEDRAAWSELPLKFEAGTQNISGVIGLAAAIDYLEKIGIKDIAVYEKQLLDQAEEMLKDIPGCVILGEPGKRAGAISFYFDGIHGYDMAKLLDQLGIALRSGHHCARPLLARFGQSNVLRLSPAFYNTADEIEYMSDSVKRIVRLLKYEM